MLTATMATTKTRSPRPKAPTGRRPGGKSPEPEGRNRLVDVGREAMREALLKALKDNDWSLTRTAEFFGMNGPPTVIRALRSLGLDAEYEAAKARGDVRPGPRAP